VTLNARAAADLGADIRVRTQVTSARRENGEWRLTLSDRLGGGQADIRAKALVNAAGPWVMSTITGVMGQNAPAKLKLVKGSHIVVAQQYEGEHAFILQNVDRRIVFVIPYEGRFTLIGTTDVVYEGDPGRVAISTEETDYLCQAANRFLARPVTPADVVWSYAGIRPLYDDGSDNASAVTRDYVLELDAGEGRAPALSIFGGKITTFRRLAEHALEKLAPFFPQATGAWTSGAKQPGGELDGSGADFERFVEDRAREWDYLPREHLRAILRRQGSRALKFLAAAKSRDDLGPHFGAGLYGAEVDLMVREEWARTSNDILFRRTKMGLHLSLAEQAVLGGYLARVHGLGQAG
jgi:glycerol-3-phosphate dehydrogenase